MVADTLNAVLGHAERKRLENYDIEKMSVLYKAVLEDKGLANIQNLINQINENARKDLDEEEKKRKRRQAITETQNLSLTLLKEKRLAAK